KDKLLLRNVAEHVAVERRVIADDEHRVVPRGTVLHRDKLQHPIRRLAIGGLDAKGVVDGELTNAVRPASPLGSVGQTKLSGECHSGVGHWPWHRPKTDAELGAVTAEQARPAVTPLARRRTQLIGT